MIVLTCAAAIAIVLTSAAPAQLEHLGQPCRAKNLLAGLVVTDRQDGRERFVLTNTNEHSGCSLIFIDFEKNTGKVIKAPAGEGAWGLNEVPGDRLVVGTYDERASAAFMVFDLKKMEFFKVAKFPGVSYIWNQAIGSDGRVYGGSYSFGKLGSLDLNTYEVTDCGAPAPPNLYLRNVSALPDGRILCHFITEQPTRLIYDPALAKFEPAPESLQRVDLGVTWNGYFLSGSKAYDGKTLAQVALPFPAPDEKNGAWSVLARLTSPDTLYLRQGESVYKFTKGDKELTLACKVSERVAFLGVSKKGELVGVRGQDYFVVKPGDTELNLKPIPVETDPRPTLFLEVDAKGRIWGGPHFGQTLFYTDPKTKKTVNTGAICDSAGEVYDVASKDDVVYAVAYVGGDIVRYEPGKPWDQWDNVNPKVLSTLSGRGYIRPNAGAMLGEDGKLYSGWMAHYGTYGGAVAITDTKTGTTELIENPLGEQAIHGVVQHGGVAFVGTSIGANGLPNKQGESAKFGVLDLATKKVVFEKTLEGALQVSVIAYDAKLGKVLVSVNDKLRLFDPAKREFADFPADTPGLGCNSVACRDGKLYYGSEATVLALDLSSGKAEKLAVAPAKVTNVAVGPDGAVYISCGVDLYAVRRK